MNRRPIRRLLAAVLLGAALAAPALGLEQPGRFDIQAAPVWSVDDTTRIAPPAARGWNRYRDYVDDVLLDPLDERLALRGAARALDLNSIDEVPTSTWFAVHPAAATPVAIDHSAPLQVLDARFDGPDPYLVVRDARGTRYWLDFDAPGAPERRTAAAIVSSRLLRAAGYATLDCDIEAITREELALTPGASLTGEFGGADQLTAKDLDRFLGRSSLAANGGKARVAASRIPAGTALGSFGERGVRADDPNDRIPHQDRRSLRGFALFAAWLDYATFREDRTLDVYLNPQRFVRHYIRGLARTLGAGPRAPQERAPEGFVALTAPGFDPRAWAPLDPCAGFEALGWGDALWATRRLLAVTPEQIQEAVEAARLSDREQAVFLAGALMERRERIARAWLDHVNGADRFTVRRSAPGRWVLEFEDLGVRAGLRLPEDVSFTMAMVLPDVDERWGFQTRGGERPAFDLVPFLPPAWLHRFDPRRYAIAEVRAMARRASTSTSTATRDRASSASRGTDPARSAAPSRRR
jgi:hypothetical protein